MVAVRNRFRPTIVVRQSTIIVPISFVCHVNSIQNVGEKFPLFIYLFFLVYLFFFCFLLFVCYSLLIPVLKQKPYMLRVSCLKLEIKEVRCYEAKIEESEKGRQLS